MASMKTKVKNKKERTKIFVCTACGKWDENKENLKDVSCYINSIQVYKDMCEFRNNGTIEQVKKGGIVEQIPVN